MDNNNDYENTESRNSNNTEYVPTKCRITKPPPPKPATNPMQFVKVAPCPLFQKAHEQIKKVEEIKKERKEVREEPEDWQQNLDNWKSCRRKRQEHIIERVVEVKKLEQEEQERHRRKNKTFNEMIEDRTRGGRHKFNIPVYDDDSNDLSDYGIGSSSSKTNSIKDVDTDDSNSILDEKDNLNASNQSQSEDESNINKSNYSSENINTSTSLYTSTKPNEKDSKPPSTNKSEPTEQYTYEGAIQDYRSRIRSKIHVDDSVFTKHENVTKSKDYSDAQTAIPKGEIFKRKELFEGEKIEISNYESPTSRRLSEDFVNSQSIKQRLKSLEKCTEQSLTRNEKNDNSKLSSKSPTEDLRNNNSNNIPRPAKISSYLIGKSESCSNLVESKNNAENFDWKKKQVSERSSSPETELYMDNLKTFSRDLDNLFGKSDNINSEYSVNPNYPPSVSSTELMGTSSDREDSGIHTADVSCSVSQADEPVEDPTELAATTIPSCIEKLSIQEHAFSENNSPTFISEIEIQPKIEEEPVVSIISSKTSVLLPPLDTTESITTPIISETEYPSQEELKDSYNNVYDSRVKPLEFLSNNDPIIVDGGFPLTPLTMIEPPKVKPPPPPPIDDDNDDLPEAEIRRINSTKRIKREIHIKRSSFLGLDEPTESQIYPEINVDKPSFMQKEIKPDRSAYKKFQEENRLGVLSKVESHDSGLDIDRGRLSSDTWCSSSIGESITPSPERQDSEQTNSITSEEDEIIKKEREIIEMVEKEEKSRDTAECVAPLENNQVILRNTQNINNTQSDPYLGSENFNKPYFPSVDLDNASYDGQDSEVLKVEHDLRQLEQEELKRKRANLLFEESRAKARLQNNRSLENIFDDDEDDAIDRRQLYRHEGVNYRKSMPDLQHASNEYRPAVDVSNNYNVYNNRPVPELDVRYRKSMPDIQHAYCKSTPEYHKTVPENAMKYALDHGKSLPDIPSVNSFNKPSPPIKRQPIMPGKPIRPVTKDQKDRFLMTNPAASDALQHPVNKTRQQLSRHSLQQLSAVPKSRPLSHDNWIQPRPNEKPNFKQHWLIQEAELRRISEQNNLAAANRWQQQPPRQEKHLPDSVIQTLTQRTQNRVEMNPPPPIRRPATGSPSKEGPIQFPKPYLGHNNQTVGHALPMPYTLPIEESQAQDRMLSVSGKKKCSNCNKELGRGAAMIIESLCLFYHMECFICCVCHVELGDGRMGTDVRVRNQKLHCHNCYSSDDGIKFSCV